MTLKSAKEYSSLQGHREVVQFGNLYRIMDIDEDEILFNQYINDDKTKSVAFIAANGTRFYKKVFLCYLTDLMKTSATH